MATTDIVRTMEHPEARSFAVRGDYAAAETRLKEDVSGDINKGRTRGDLARLYETWAQSAYEVHDYPVAAEKLKRYLELAVLDQKKEFKARLLLVDLYRRMDRMEASLEALKDLEARHEGIPDPYFQNQILNEREISEKRTVLASYPNRLTVRPTNQCNVLCTMCDMGTHKPW